MLAVPTLTYKTYGSKDKIELIVPIGFDFHTTRRFS
nr:MAG TPA: hypothetical protein [Caudoviricetes sp.]